MSPLRHVFQELFCAVLRYADALVMAETAAEAVPSSQASAARSNLRLSTERSASPATTS